MRMVILFGGKFTSFSLVSLNFVFVLLYVLETYSLSKSVLSVFWILVVVITGFFSLEYLDRIYSSEKSFKKFFEPLMVVDLLAILPVYLILLGPGFTVSAGFL